MAKQARMRPERAQRDLFSQTQLETGSAASESGRLLARRPQGGSARTARLPSELDAPAAPFLKWAGGKTQLLPQLFNLLPRESWRAYHEPFVGGGAMFFALAPQRATLSDLNPELVNCYQVIRRELEPLIEVLSAHVYERDHYYEVRAWDPTQMDRVSRAARFMYLNRTCFNGLHRVNRAGQFNVPFGKYSNPTICDETNLRRVAAALENVDITCAGYDTILQRAQRGDFVYFDPPYAPISATSNFTSYTSSTFGPEEQRKLAGVFAELDRRGCKVMLSNSNAQFIRELYRDYDVREVLATRAINRDASKRGPIAELVVRNFE